MNFKTINSNTIIQTLASFSFLAICTFPVLPLTLSGILVLVILIASLASFLFSGYKKKSRQSNVLLLALIVLPVYYFTELLYADDLQDTWFILQRKLALVVLPLSGWLFYSSAGKLNIKIALNVFSISVIGLVLYLLILLGINGLNPEHLETGGLAFALRTKAEEITAIHPTYISMFIGFSGSIFFHRFFLQTKRMEKALYFTAFSLLLVVLIVLSARMAIFATGLAIIFLMYHHRKELRSYKFLLGGLAFITVTFVLLYPPLQSRLLEVFSSESNSTTVRSVIWSCSVDQLKQNWLLGSGVEHFQENLNLCYKEKNAWGDMNGIVYNTHNEYLNVWCTKGILGFALFIVLIVLLFAKAKSNPQFTSFLIIFFTICFTENLLERQMGVMFFALFSSVLLFFSPPELKNENG